MKRHYLPVLETACPQAVGLRSHAFIVAFISIFLLATTFSGASAKSLPADVGPGRVAWFDITTTNLTQAKDFYGKLFGWTFEPVKGTDQAAEIVASGTSIGTLRSADGKITPYNGVVYIQVSELEASCKKARELGGTILPGFPFDLPDGTGAIGLVLDPSGHPVGLYSKTPLKPSAPPSK